MWHRKQGLRLSKNRIYIMVSVVFCLVSFFPFHSLAKTTLKVGIYNFEPLVFIDESGKGKGLFVDILNYIAEQEKWNIRYIPGSWNECLTRLIDGEIDLLGSIAYSEERAEKLDFTDNFLFLDWGLVYKKKGVPIKTIFDLEGKKISVLKGSIYTIRFKKMLDQFGIKSTILEENEYTQVFDSIESGKTDAGINAQVYGMRIESNYDIERTQIFFSPVKIRFAVPKGHQQLTLKKIDDYLSILKADPQSIYYSFFDKWVGLYKKKPLLPKWLVWVFVLLSILLCLVLFFNILLNRSVKSKTEELITSNNELLEEIKDRKQAVEALKKNEEKFRQLAENISEVFWIGSLDWIEVYYISPAYEEIWGFSCESLYDNPRSWLDTIVEEDRDQVVAAIPDNFDNRSEIDFPEYRILRLDGSVRWIHARAYPVRDDFGKIYRIAGIAEDITERKQTELEKEKLQRQLQQEQKMKTIGTLAGGIAHDFNNILGGILGFSELLQEDLKEIECPDDVHDRIEYILKGGIRAKELVAQILAFSRSGEENLGPVKVVLIAKEVTQLLRASLPATIEIKKSFFSNSMVMADATKIHQIFMNLCTNAGYAMKENGGILSISMKDVFLDEKALAGQKDVTHGTFLLVSVTDTGLGMGEETITKIMEPFFTTKPKEKGTGMGLWVVHGIIKSMGGFIDISSKIGQGSKFDVYMPVFNDAKESVKTHTEKEMPMGDENILFVDDELSLTQLAKESLSGLGYSVTTFNNSVEALDSFRHNLERYDLVITDMTMPEMTGDILCRQIRLIKPDIRVMLISGFDESRDEKIRALNFDAILNKPVLIRDMATAIRNVLDRNKQD